MLNGMGRGLVLQSSHTTNRQLIPNWGQYVTIRANSTNLLHQCVIHFQATKASIIMHSYQQIAFLSTTREIIGKDTDCLLELVHIA